MSLLDDAGGRFSLDGDGTLRVAGAIDREAADRYTVVVRAQSSDGSTADRSVTIEVGDLNEWVPRFTSLGGAAAAQLAQAENLSDVLVLTATDADRTAPALRYAVAGGEDAALFDVDAASGQLRFRSPPDRETPGDANRDGVYVVQVTASDGVLTGVQTLSIAVSNVNEAPDVVVSDLALLQGDLVNLQGRWLAAHDVDTPDAELVFTVQGVEHGHFATVDAPAATLQRFTWADVTAGRVVFVHDGSTTAPEVMLQLNDGSTTRLVRAAASLRLMDTSPDTTDRPTTPAPAAPPATPGPSGTSSTSPAVPGADREGDPGTSDPVGSSLDALQRNARMARGERESDSAVNHSEDPSAATLGPAGSVDRRASIDDRSRPPATLAMDATGGAVNTVEAMLASAIDPDAAPESLSTGFLSSTALGITPSSSSRGAGAGPSADVPVDGDEAPAPGLDLRIRPDDIARAGGLAFSVGALFWVSRAGGLISSLLLSLPAWRQFDPLPVMAATPTNASAERTGKTRAEAPDTVGDFDALADDILERAQT